MTQVWKNRINGKCNSWTRECVLANRHKMIICNWQLLLKNSGAGKKLGGNANSKIIIHKRAKRETSKFYFITKLRVIAILLQV